MVILSLSVIQLDINSQRQIAAQNATKFEHPFPKMNDPHLKVELVADGLLVPTGMLFLDKDNILVLQRYTSGFPLGGLTTVNLITNGTERPDPVLTVPTGLCDNRSTPQTCNIFNERGLLGITAKKINVHNPTLANNLQVYLYYTEVTLNGEVLGNRVYRYLWDGNNLINPSLVLDLPALPSQSNVGGKILIGPDNNLYVVIGDVTISNKTVPIHENSSLLKQILCCPIGHRNQLQNIQYGDAPDNTSVILRVNAQNGLPVSNNPFFHNSSLNSNTTKTTTSDASSEIVKSENTQGYNASLASRYYAYGIRNSFGLAFDPLTGNLWDTENGEKSYDELNLVKPGFNSGWAKVMGPMNRINATNVDIGSYGNYTFEKLNLKESNVTQADLVNLPGSNYSDPKFSWKNSIGVTALGFLNSSKLGEKYKDNLFVGDYAYGNLYYFKLNKNRNGLEFNKNQVGLSDFIADNPKERSEIVLGTGFDIITDIQTGPNGYLYIVSYSEYSNNRPNDISRIYRIVPSSVN